MKLCMCNSAAIFFTVLYTKVNSSFYISINSKYKKISVLHRPLCFLYFLLFSGCTPIHINNTHISLNCLALSSEAPREEKE
jgi:hypothetical protein